MKVHLYFCPVLFSHFAFVISFKVRQRLANEKQARENAEKVKKMRRMKKFGKKVCVLNR